MKLRDVSGAISDTRIVTMLRPKSWRDWWLDGTMLAIRKRNTEARKVLEIAKRLAPAEKKPRIEATLKRLR